MLKQIGDLTQIVYATAIAQQLSAYSDQTAEQIADQLKNFVSNDTFNGLDKYVPLLLPATVVQDVTIRTLSSGLIQFELGDRAIAAWLNQIIYHPPTLNQGIPEHQNWENAASFIFTIQHAHARCCSLLQLAHREGLIILDQSDASPVRWRWVTPAAIPWVDSNAQLWLQHHSERRLVGQLIYGLDRLFYPSPPPSLKDLLRLAQEVSHRFQDFYRDRPLWSSLGNKSRGLFYAQLGLVMATQRLIYLLLEEGLGFRAPTEL